MHADAAMAADPKTAAERGNAQRGHPSTAMPSMASPSQQGKARHGVVQYGQAPHRQHGLTLPSMGASSITTPASADRTYWLASLASSRTHGSMLDTTCTRSHTIHPSSMLDLRLDILLLLCSGELGARCSKQVLPL